MVGRWLVGLALVLAGNVASADPVKTIDEAFPPTIRLDAPGSAATLARVTVDVRSAPAITWVTIELTSRWRREHTDLPIDLPRGTRIVGLQHRHADRSIWGSVVPRRDARAAFDDAQDAALLAWASTSVDADHFTLSVPLPSTLELALELPPLAKLAIDAAVAPDQLVVVVDGTPVPSEKPARAHAEIALATIAAQVADDSYPHVDPQMSLVAARARQVITLPHTIWVSDTFGGKEIRRVVKQHGDQLRECWMRVAQWSPVDGELVLHFRIHPDGTVQAEPTEGALPTSITACLEREAASWEFPPSDGEIHVNYPLRFRLNR